MSGRTTPPLRVAVELTERDVVLAHFWTIAQMPALRLFAAVHVVLLLGALLVVVRAVARGERVPPVLLAGALVLVVIFVGLPLQVRREARSRFHTLGAETLRGDYVLDGEGFAWTLGPSPGRAPWSAVTRIAETRNHVLLLTGRTRPHVIPKSGLSHEELARLRACISAVLSSGQ